MAEQTQILLSHKELLELMIKKEGIHDGLWMIAIEFQFAATITGADPALLPAGILGVSRVGIQRTTVASNLSVDAAVINPGPSAAPKRAKKIAK